MTCIPNKYSTYRCGQILNAVKVKEKKVKEPRPLLDPKRFLSEHSSFFGILTTAQKNALLMRKTKSFLANFEQNIKKSKSY